MEEVLVLIARLLVLGEISLMMDGTLVSLDKAYDALMTPTKRRKVVILTRQTTDPKALQNARGLGKDVFHEMGPDGEDALFSFLRNKLKDWQSSLSRGLRIGLPGELSSEVGRWSKEGEVRKGLERYTKD